MTTATARLLAAATALSLAAAAQAQSVSDDTASEDTITPRTFTTPGGSEAVARGMLMAMKLEQKARDYCFEYGCLVIVNESPSFKVTGFHVQTADRRGRLRWSPNQFGNPLQARRATFRFKTGDASACDLPVLFVLRHLKTKEEVRVEGRAALCKSPRVDSLLRINVHRPSVFVEPADR